MPRQRSRFSWASAATFGLTRLGMTVLVAAALGAAAAGCLLDSGPFEVVTAATSVGGAGGSAGAGGAGGAAGSETGGGGSEPVCGDAVKGPMEECDDGNSIEGDGCFECILDCGCPGCVAGTPCAGCGPVDGAMTFKDPGSKHCYAFIPLLRTQDLAQQACEAWHGGALVAPSTQAEMDVIDRQDLITVFARGTSARCWTGGRHDGTWGWLNGEEWLLPPEGPEWEPGNPNGGAGTNCVVIGSNGKIRDRGCDELFPFLCERILR